MKKLVLISSLIIVMLVSLVGCASDGGNSDTANSSSAQGGSVSFSDYLKKGDSVWFLVSEDQSYGTPSKDSNVEDVLILNDSDVVYYEDLDLTLGDFAQMEDDSYIEAIKKICEDKRNARISEEIDNNQSAMNDYKEMWEKSGIVIDTYEKVIKELESYKLVSAGPTKYTKKIFTDATGNATSYEQISFNYKYDLLPHTDSSTSDDYMDIFVEGKIEDSSFQEKLIDNRLQATIYDSFYSGFTNDNNGYFITRCPEGTLFMFDDVGTEGIEVD